MTSFGRTKTRVGLRAGAITAGKGPAELGGQDGGARGFGRVSGVRGEKREPGVGARGRRRKGAKGT